MTTTTNHQTPKETTTMNTTTITISTAQILDAACQVGISGYQISFNLSKLNQGPIVMANDWAFLPTHDACCFGIMMSPGQAFRFLTEMNRQVPDLGTDLSDMMRTSQTHKGNFVWFPEAVNA
jgi:hypothetical protein